MTRPFAQARRASRQRLFLYRALALIVLCLVAALAARFFLFNGPKVTVTLTPGVLPKEASYQLTAVTGTPDPASDQTPARLLAADSPTQSAAGTVANAIPPTQATGPLTFVNDTTMPITVPTGAVTDSHGVTITFSGPFVVKVFPETTTVPGTALKAGSAGNITAFDIDIKDYMPGITVKNEVTFSGGAEAVPGLVQQSDIDHAAREFVKDLTPQAQANLQALQVKPTERVADSSAQCQPKISAHPQAGQEAVTIAVTISVTCSELAYDVQAAQTLASTLLAHSVRDDPRLGAAYTLQHQMVFRVLNSRVENADQGRQVELSVEIHGLLVYTASDDLKITLARQIAGKSKADAQKLLLQYPWIASVHFSSPDNLPTNAGAIQFVEVAPATMPSNGFAVVF